MVHWLRPIFMLWNIMFESKWFVRWLSKMLIFNTCKCIQKMKADVGFIEIIFQTRLFINPSNNILMCRATLKKNKVKWGLWNEITSNIGPKLGFS